MEVPKLGVESELQLLAYTTDAATPDPNLMCNLHHSSQQHRILHPLNGAASSWILVRFISAAPQQELQKPPRSEPPHCAGSRGLTRGTE